MKIFGSQKIDVFMQDIQSVSADKYKTGMAIRELFYQLSNDITEEIKYGGLLFYCSQEMISGIFFYKQHISIEFGQGYEFSDPESVLEGKGKFRRHIKINNLDEIQSKNVEGYIQQAIDKS